MCSRCHAEFQLHEPPEMPFWFTPAQFAGRLVISRDFSHIAAFEVELPTVKTLNIGVYVCGFFFLFFLCVCVCECACGVCTYVQCMCSEIPSISDHRCNILFFVFSDMEWIRTADGLENQVDIGMHAGTHCSTPIKSY